MCRAINAQAEFWMKVGMLAEANPTPSFAEIMARRLKDADVQVPAIEAALRAGGRAEWFEDPLQTPVALTFWCTASCHAGVSLYQGADRGTQ